MPYQNRVTPFSTIEENSSRGMYMGNRGILHDDTQTLKKQTWQHKSWVTCTLQHTDKKGRNWHRKIMQPGKYTELFFLDEPTALAAGHRPCALCRNADYKRYISALDIQFPTVKDLDKQLHLERTSRFRKQKNYRSGSINNLPNGGMFTSAKNPATPFLKWQNQYWPWSHSGYGKPVPIDDELVSILTPQTSVSALRGGYKPIAHGF